MSDNPITKIPKEISSFKYLSSLYLNDLKLTDSKFIDVLPLLDTLTLRNANLSKLEIPEKSKIVILDLSENKLDDTSSFKNLKEVEYLNISNNQIKDISPIKNLQRIFDFNANGNPLGSKVKKTGSNCPINSKSKVVSEWCQSKFN